MKSANLVDLDAWFDFKTELTKSYPYFFDALRQKHPNLSSREIKICSLLFLDCSSKEVGEKLRMDSHSVDSARSRLRKKFGLKEDDELPSYLKSLM